MSMVIPFSWAPSREPLGVERVCQLEAQGTHGEGQGLTELQSELLRSPEKSAIPRARDTGQDYNTRARDGQRLMGHERLNLHISIGSYNNILDAKLLLKTGN
eukprot:5596510-Pyramimonas_sp.AAC.1